MAIGGNPEDAQIVLGKRQVGGIGEKQVELFRLGVEDQFRVQIEGPRADPRIPEAQRQATELARRLDAAAQLGRRIALHGLDVQGQAVRRERDHRAACDAAHPRVGVEEAAGFVRAISLRMPGRAKI